MSPFSDMSTESDELVWRALADPVRRQILDKLAKSPSTTGEIVECIDGLCRTAVMKHLDVLVAANLVLVRRAGRVRWNYLNPVPIEQVCQRWVNKHVNRLSSAMNRLKDVVESEVSTKTKGKQKCQKTK
jgi:DNA-binding transcriptional ArsR family regulator